ncbi:thiamine phosphate synthase [Leeuwenhoekiella marinoflava]|uniref:thiamine phosphate synthase n=1 Tax=Leeuwenhoekiella marinoflava TaxID=988 RepID=UPI003002E928
MLVVITSEDFHKNEISLIRQIIDSGLDFLHVRKPQASRKQMQEWLEKFDTAYRQKMMLHQHHDLAVDFNCLGVHFKEKDRKSEEAFFKEHLLELQKSGLKISTGFHDLETLREQSALYNYSFLSPVFTSISKKGYAGKSFEVLDFDENVIALGGITLETINRVKQKSFNGVAVLGAVWLTANPFNSFLKIKNAYEKSYK